MKNYETFNNFEYVILNDKFYSYYTYSELINDELVYNSKNSELANSCFDIVDLSPKYCALFAKLYQGTETIDWFKMKRILYQDEEQSLVGERMIVTIEDDSFVFFDITIIVDDKVVPNPLLDLEDIAFIRSLGQAIKDSIVNELNK